MRKAFAALGFGLGFVVFLFALMVVPKIGGISEALLTPGYSLPEAYWGGVHDPLQLLAAFILNVAFYAVIAAILLWAWGKRKRRVI